MFEILINDRGLLFQCGFFVLLFCFFCVFVIFFRINKYLSLRESVSPLIVFFVIGLFFLSRYVLTDEFLVKFLNRELDRGVIKIECKHNNPVKHIYQINNPDTKMWLYIKNLRHIDTENGTCGVILTKEPSL
jgi:hypothetical protein